MQRMRKSSNVSRGKNRDSVGGKIKSIYCKHFVTYEECTFHPTPYLNILIGPNGTGKSTLVAAIVLGLGGDPKLLSRSNCIEDYIKNGREEATIVVEIYTDNIGRKAVKFGRHIVKSGSSVFNIDSKKVSKSDFLQQIANLKIQISNLCQFLPQDRVQDFAKMNPQEIFSNTIVSVCSQKLCDEFEQLKNIRKIQKESKTQLDTDKEKLQRLETRLEELKNTLQRYNVQKEFEKKLKMCHLKKIWLEAQEIESQISQIKIDLTIAKQKQNLAKKAYENINKQKENMRNKSIQLEETAAANEQNHTCTSKRLNEVVTAIETIKENMLEKKANYDAMKRTITTQKKEIISHEQLLEAFKQDLANAEADAESSPNENSYDDEIKNLKQESLLFMKKRSDINDKLDSDFIAEVQMLKKRLATFQNVAEQKKELLKRQFPDVYRAIQIIEEKTSLLQGKVYNPMLLEINITDPRNAKYFENIISLRDLLAFTCEKKEDLTVLIEELCVKAKLSVNLVHSHSANEIKFTPKMPINSIQSYGFTDYLVNLLDGPPAIINYLCSLYNIHNIPIGTEKVNTNIEKIPKDIVLYFGGVQRYSVCISKYTNERSIMQTHIKVKNILHSVDKNEVESCKARLNDLLLQTDALKNQRSKCETKIEALEYQKNELMKKKREIQSKMARVREVKMQLTRQNNKISEIRRNIEDSINIEQRFVDDMKGHLIERIKMHCRKSGFLLKLKSNIIDKGLADIKVEVFRRQNSLIEEEINSASENLKEANGLVERIKTSLNSNEKMYRNKISQFDGNILPIDSNFEHKSAFQELPNTIDEIRKFTNEYSARLECFETIDQSICEEYQDKTGEVQTLKNKIEKTINEDKNCVGNINNIFKNWYQNISNVIDTMNTHFNNFMISMGYAGEIALCKQQDLEFDTYGIEIKVQYRRNVPLQRLNRYVQSGGERAVAIAVYMLALQHINQVPLCCVDELNQGMDALNERKIFEMFIRETTKEGRAQQFFVTPKLPPNLSYNEKLSVHVVFNGKMMEKNVF